MPDSFIVTIRHKAENFEIDLEIPSRLSFSAFKAKLLEILKMINAKAFYGWSNYTLSFKGDRLGEQETLAQAGAFDGSVLEITRM